jgi:hypothetical protein
MGSIVRRTSQEKVNIPAKLCGALPFINTGRYRLIAPY